MGTRALAEVALSKTKVGLVVSIGCLSGLDNISRRVKIGLTPSVTMLISLFRCTISVVLSSHSALKHSASISARSQSFRFITLQKFHADGESTS
jgi:hypothetical protein